MIVFRGGLPGFFVNFIHILHHIKKEVSFLNLQNQKQEPNQIKNDSKKRKQLLLIAGGIVLLLILFSLPYAVKSIYWIGIIETAIIWSVFAMSLDLLVGYGGLMSMGHGAFFGVAAYAVAIMTTRFGYGSLSSILLALLFSGLLALIIGLLSAHLKGLIFMMVTIAFTQVVWGCAMQMTNLTNGDNGLSGISRPLFGGNVMSDNAFFYFVLISALVCAAILIFITQSPYGLAIKGLKQSESRMRVLGYNVWLYKVITNVISGIIAGAAGILFVFYSGFVGVTDVAVTTSSKALLMVLAGGAGTLFGPVIGAVTIVFSENIISGITERWPMIMGLIYIIVVLFLPNGIVGLIKGKKRKGLKEDIKSLTNT
jgi:branched-chain amino acid transport system permease protein